MGLGATSLQAFGLTWGHVPAGTWSRMGPHHCRTPGLKTRIIAPLLSVCIGIEYFPSYLRMAPPSIVSSRFTDIIYSAAGGHQP